jgi:hypothetical protein
LERPYLKKIPSQKWAGGVAQGVDPEFKPQYCKNKKEGDNVVSTLVYPQCNNNMVIKN